MRGRRHGHGRADTAAVITPSRNKANNMKHWRIELDADGIALITFDMAERKVNTLNAETLAEFGQLVERIRTDDAIKGVVLVSAKPGSFCAGGDLEHIETFAGPG